MNLPYRISGSVMLDSAAFASPPLLSDSKALLSESDIFATSARGSCDVDPGPVPSRMVILSALPIGDLLNDVRNREVLVPFLMFSTFAMPHFTPLALRGGGTDLTLMRPTKTLPGA